MDDAPCNVEAESGPLPDFFCGEKRIENPVEHFWRYAFAVVDDLDHHPVIRGAGFEADVSARRGVYRVVDQVRPDLIQLTAVPLNSRQIVRHAQIDLDLPAPCLRTEHRDRVGQAAADRDRLERGLL